MSTVDESIEAAEGIRGVQDVQDIRDCQDIQDAGSVEDDSREDVTLDELAGLNEERAATYALVARLYRAEPDAACLAGLRRAKLPVQTGNADADEGYRYIATFLSRTSDGDTLEAARDFARCFVGEGVNAHAAAYPYESVYTSEKRLLMQQARDEVLAIYRSEGFDKSADCRETEDHIALELEFMQVLATRTAQVLRAGDEDGAASLLRVQLNFLLDHLLVWAGAFTAELRSYARTDLYRGLACLTDGLLASDRAFLEGVLGAGEKPVPGTAE